MRLISAKRRTGKWKNRTVCTFMMKQSKSNKIGSQLTKFKNIEESQVDNISLFNSWFTLVPVTINPFSFPFTIATFHLKRMYIIFLALSCQNSILLKKTQLQIKTLYINNLAIINYSQKNTLEITVLYKFPLGSSSSMLSRVIFLQLFSIEKPISGRHPRISKSILRFPTSVLFIGLLQLVCIISNKQRTELLLILGR